MDCRRYSAASRLEVLLDEDDFRSFRRALESGNVLLLSQLHVTILEVNVYVLHLGGLLFTYGSLRS